MDGLRENGYRREIGEGRIMPFEEKVLASGLCDFTLPASFINEKDKKWVVYDCGGYTALSELPLTEPDKVLEVYPAIDTRRLCCTGGSYGGYMSNWILGHTDRFCCIATMRLF